MLGVLTSRWFLSLLGTFALAALVWFLGPLLGFAGTEPLGPPAHRWWLIAGLFVLWAGWQIGAWASARRHNRRMVDDLAAGGAGAPDQVQLASAEELATLQARFEEALGLLKAAEGRKGLGGHWVYQLPWYLLIGPPGCGKTTALVNSGLRFPLAERLGEAPIAGVGGTRNCDWWFADQAVLLDTAGRYTTQDSYSQVDSAAWQGFLALLKKHRPRRPINGVLLGISLADLMQWSPAERDAHAKAIRQRVQELYATFRIRFPIYVLFMKADLVAGFTEFFADLGKEGREQVWGMTFPFNPAPEAPLGLAGFADEHQGLLQRVDQRLLERLQAERDPRRRGLVFSFPRQFAALGEPIERFLTDCLDVTRFEARPLVRGVYFTSATQTGTPIDRVLAAIAANFGVGRQGPPPFSGTAKSFFVTRLLREVVFKEAALVGLDPRLEQRRRWVARGAYAGAILLALTAVGVWTLSYLNNRAYITEVDRQVAAIQTAIDGLKGLGGPSGRDLLGMLPLLNDARRIPRGYGDREAAPPLGMDFGLDQGEKLGSQAQRTYRRILHKTLLPMITLQLEEQIRQALVDPARLPTRLYDTLRAYLMLDDADHYDPAVLKAWIEQDWARHLPRETTTDQRTELSAHLGALLETRPTPLPLALDGDLIQQARDLLTGTRLAPRLYGRLQQFGVAAGLPDFTISQAGGPLTPHVLVRNSRKPLNQGIPALYTYDGYHQRFAGALASLIATAALESWVLGPQARILPGTPEASALVQEVRELYLRDYVTRWSELLKDLALVPPRDLKNAADLADALGNREDSPLRRVLVAAARETELDRPPAPGALGGIATGVAGTVAGSVVDQTVSRLGGIAGVAASDLRRRVGEEAGAAQTQPEEVPEAYVTRQFTWLHDLVRGAGDKPAPIDKALESVAQLGLHLRSVDAAATSGRGTLAVGTGTEVQAARQAAASQPPVLAGLLGTLVQDSGNLVAGGARVHLNNLWTADILPFCREAIQGRYPFEAGSRQETTLADFGRLFGPAGLLEGFFRENLAPLVDSSRQPWRWVNAELGVSSAVLIQFQRAGVIRNAFFAGGGKTPAVEFELTPTRLDSTAIQFTLDLGGQVLDYRHGPLKAQGFKWPAPEGPGRVRLTFTDLNGKTVSETADGPWAWFRVLERARLQPTRQPEVFRLTFQVGGFSADFELRATSVRNPFNFRELRGFSCPDRL